MFLNEKYISLNIFLSAIAKLVKSALKKTGYLVSTTSFDIKVT